MELSWEDLDWLMGAGGGIEEEEGEEAKDRVEQPLRRRDDDEDARGRRWRRVEADILEEERREGSWSGVIFWGC